MTETADRLRVTGRAWVFGDDVNTDDMYPGFAMRLPLDEAARHMFDASRPGWPELVHPGDIVVAGRDLGLGSSRPVPLLFRELGVAALVSDQFNSLFFRNCVNYGLPPVTVPGITERVAEGDVLDLDLEASRLVNTATGATETLTPLPGFLLDILRAGGLFPRLEADGYLRPQG
jgi:3-isopropylmalate/(R)-2-methylmalate dehydratase small subunit